MIYLCDDGIRLQNRVDPMLISGYSGNVSEAAFKAAVRIARRNHRAFYQHIGNCSVCKQAIHEWNRNGGG